MSRRIIATVASYGYRRTYWEKGQITELPDGEKVPEYFSLLDGKEEVKKPEPSTEPTTLSEVATQELIDEAIQRGIKDAKILNQDELLEVLAKDVKKERIAEIVKAAKARAKKK